VRDAWIAAAHGIGSAITVRQGARTREGLFGGIDEHGRLLFDEGPERSIIDAADVIFRKAAAP
jgi:biotin-(acetyl-CoA carboxylase) ligase